jgi:hypothetical protein
MRIELSNHARMRALQRGVSFEQIIDFLENPNVKTLESNGNYCFKKLQLPSSKYLLLCFEVESEKTLRVVTVILTSQVKKYL